MDESNNFRPLHGVESVDEDPCEGMAAFDALPPELRRLLRDAPVSVAVVPVLRMYRRRCAQRGSKIAGLKAAEKELQALLAHVRRELRRELAASNKAARR